MGKYPGVTLLEARRARDVAKGLLQSGIDPSADRKSKQRKRTIAAGNTFELVANEWFNANQVGWVETYSSRLRSRLDDDLLPALGKRPIADIEPLEILDAIRKIEKRDAIEMAKRVMQMASGIFRYGVATARCGRDPTVDLKGALKPARPSKGRTALPAKELPAFLAALETYDGDLVTKLGMKLLILTFVRTSELRFARWTEFEGLLEALRDGDLSATAVRFVLPGRQVPEREDVAAEVWTFARPHWDANTVESVTFQYEKVTVERLRVEELWPLNEIEEATPEASPRARELRLAPDSEIGKSITDIYDLAERSGSKAPNIKELSKAVVELLKERGFEASENHIQVLGKEPPHSLRRRKPGRTLKSERSRAKSNS